MSPRASAPRRCRLRLRGFLQRSPNILVIPGTSSLKHLRENLQASKLRIPAEVLADLDANQTRGKRSLKMRGFRYRCNRFHWIGSSSES